MTKDDIIRMAREADVWVAEQEPYQTQLERFAALVAAAEREACAKIADAELAKYPPWAPFNQYQSGIFTAAEHISEAIRARGYNQ